MVSKVQVQIDYNYLFSNGIIGAWYLRDSQIPLYNLILTKKRIVCSCRRRFGKTTALIVAILELCIAKSGLRVYYGAPQLKQARDILSQVLDHIYIYAPHLKPKYNTQDGCYMLPNGSRIVLFGAKDSSELDKCRGQEADIIVLDEFGHFKYKPEYIMKEVLLPMLLTTHGKLIISSTPSKDLTHPYFTAIREAQMKKEFFIHTIEDSIACGDISEEEHKQIIEDCGGIDSESYQREWLCRVVPPISSLIIPEASQRTDWLLSPEEVAKFKQDLNYRYYHRYMSMDIGSVDYTCILYYTYIFDKDLIFIEGETVLKNEEVTTRNIAAKIKEKQKLLWGDCSIFRAVADNNNPILLRDLANTERVYFGPIQKDSLVAMVNSARLNFQSGRIKINPDCTYLVNCLKYGLWNDHRTEFLRSDSLGHLDALAALIYGVRIVDKSTNPIPFTRDADVFYPLGSENTTDESTQLFKSVLRL